MQINLAPEIEKALIQQAKQTGISSEQLANDLLGRQLLADQAISFTDRNTLADFLGNFVGALQSGNQEIERSNWSENTGKRFGELMVRKHREGR